MRGLLLLLLIFVCCDLYGLGRDSVAYNLSFDEVVFSARRDLPNVIPSQKLSAAELERLSVHSVADAIRYFSGVQIKDYGGIGGLKTVNIRSMGSQHVGVFYDGVEVGNAQNGTVDLGRFSLDNMEAVELYNGQKSSIFQPAKDFASAGSVYMQSRRPTFESTKNYNLKGTFKTGSFDLVNPSVLYEQKFSENISSSMNAEYMRTSGKYKFTYQKEDGYTVTDTRQNGDVESMRVEGGLFGKINSVEWRTKIYYYGSERGYPGAYVRSVPGTFENADRQWDENLFVQGSFRKSISSFYSLLVSGKYAHDYLRYVGADSGYDNQYWQQEGYISVANQFKLYDWWSTNLSVDYLRNTLDSDTNDFAYPRRSTLLAAAATSMSAGRVKMQASVLYTFVAESTSSVAGAAEDKSEWTPTAIVSYRPFADVELDIRAFYKRIFRMPTFNDLYYSFIGNTSLKPEYTNQYNVGVAYTKGLNSNTLKNLNLQVDAYYNEVENKIVAMPTSNQFRWTMLNLGQCEIRGVDFAGGVEWQVSKVGLTTRLNYTYQRAQDFTDPTDTYYGDQIPYIPWHSGSAVLGATLGRWEMNYSFIYTGERYEMQANILENYAQPWYTHDMSLSKAFDFKGCAMRVSAEVNNIFNQQYEVVDCYPMPGVNVKFTINVTI